MPRINDNTRAPKCRSFGATKCSVLARSPLKYGGSKFGMKYQIDELQVPRKRTGIGGHLGRANGQKIAHPLRPKHLRVYSPLPGHSDSQGNDLCIVYSMFTPMGSMGSAVAKKLWVGYKASPAIHSRQKKVGRVRWGCTTAISDAEDTGVMRCDFRSGDTAWRPTRKQFPASTATAGGLPAGGRPGG